MKEANFNTEDTEGRHREAQSEDENCRNGDLYDLCDYDDLFFISLSSIFQIQSFTSIYFGII
ncbi:MAG: hypothetical protein EPN82_09575 [Bacteroidetes bacterium]|nr:MAG: hypothetical protein EPN82_09575 [Bacteroidota bacterium]